MRRSATLLAASAVLALSACGGGSSSDDGGMTEVTVGVIPIVDTAAIWLGDDQGFFEEEGIDLTLEVTSGGAAAVPGVVSDSFDFAFGNLISGMVANDQGLDLRYVANGNSVSAEEDRDIGAVVVQEDSDIESVEDLAGKSVSVNNLSNIGDTTIRKAVQDAGGDQSTIDFVEIAFPDAPAALAGGQVDAAWILEPFLSVALEEGARVVSYNFKETHPELDIAGYFTKGETVENDPELVERFSAAMNRSLEFAQENPDEVRRIVGTYTELDEAALEAIALPQFRPEFNREAVEVLGAAAVEYGTLEQAPDLDRILP